MTKPALRSIPSELPDPPYPADTKANGFNVEFDIQRILSSDTWVLASPDERAWLLRIWFEAWMSVPVGTMPGDMDVFAARIGVPREYLDIHSKILMRGWILHADGKLYHQHITAKVLEMRRRRTAATERMRKHRKAKSDVELQRSDGVSHVTYAQEQEQEQEEKTPPIVPPKGGSMQLRFDEFWDAYPKKVGKKSCTQIWKRRKLDSLADLIIADVKRRRLDDTKWADGFVPNPQTYLNGDRWEDEIVTRELQSARTNHANQPRTAIERIEAACAARKAARDAATADERSHGFGLGEDGPNLRPPLDIDL